MSYIALSRRSLSDHWINTVCLTDYDGTVLLPYVQEMYDAEYKKWEKYNDIHEGGEATLRQENLRTIYSENVDILDLLLCNLKERIKK